MLQKYLDKYLDKGFIRVSSLPIAVLVIFIKKPSSSLRFCIDYLFRSIPGGNSIAVFVQLYKAEYRKAQREKAMKNQPPRQRNREWICVNH